MIYIGADSDTAGYARNEKREMRKDKQLNTLFADFVEFSSRETVREAPHLVANPMLFADTMVNG